MSQWFDSHKPAAPARTHLALAALMWSVVGGVLLGLGVVWTSTRAWHEALGLAALAAAVGAAKAHLVLDRAAARIAARITTRGEGRCLGGFLSLRSWALVAVMAGAGRLLRGGLLPRPVVGAIYIAVGTAITLSSRRLWVARARADRRN